MQSLSLRLILSKSRRTIKSRLKAINRTLKNQKVALQSLEPIIQLLITSFIIVLFLTQEVLYMSLIIELDLSAILSLY